MLLSRNGVHNVQTWRCNDSNALETMQEDTLRDRNATDGQYSSVPTLRASLVPRRRTFLGMNKLGPCFCRFAMGGLGLGLGLAGAPSFCPEPLASSLGGSSARRFCPTCASSDDAAGVGADADAAIWTSAASRGGVDGGGAGSVDVTTFERPARDLSSLGVMMSGGSGGGACEGGLGALEDGAAATLVYAFETGAVKYDTSACARCTTGKMH